jgi:hypothetical protein
MPAEQFKGIELALQLEHPEKRLVTAQFRLKLSEFLGKLVVWCRYCTRLGDVGRAHWNGCLMVFAKYAAPHDRG